MYGKNFTQGNKNQARWRRWSGTNHASRRFKQYRLPISIKSSYKTALRHRHAIQHLQQRFFIGIMAVYERKAGLDFCRSISQSKSRVNTKVASGANRSRIVAKQSKLVWPHLAITRPYQRIGNNCKQLASWILCKMAESRVIKKLPSPCGGLIDPSISPHYGQIALLIYPCYGLIKGCFDAFLSPYCGHLLDIPLYTTLIGGITND